MKYGARFHGLKNLRSSAKYAVKNAENAKNPKDEQRGNNDGSGGKNHSSILVFQFSGVSAFAVCIPALCPPVSGLRFPLSTPRSSPFAAGRLREAAMQL
jgi:hypothetical protein